VRDRVGPVRKPELHQLLEAFASDLDAPDYFAGETA